MKIPFTTLELNLTNKKVIVTEREKVITQITKLQQYRIRQDIQKWRTAITVAEQVFFPTRFLIYQTYRDAVLDAHLSGLISQRKDRIMLKEFAICTGADVENTDLTEMFRAQWFNKFLEYALDSIFWGYSLVQFGDFDTKTGFDEIELVPRINVRPERGEFVTISNNPTGPSYLEGAFADYALGVGERFNLGLLMKASFYTITKNATIGIWGEYTELFGIPPRILKTNVRDEITRKNGEKMMENMSRAPWAVIDTSDELDFGSVSGAGKNGAQIFDDLIQLCNKELSKLILGHSAAADTTAGKMGNEKQAVDIGAEKEAEDSRFISFVVKDQLFPFMRNLGFKIPEDAYIKWDNSEELKEQKEQAADYGMNIATMVNTMSQAGYEMNEKEISELLSMEVTKKPEPKVQPQVSQFQQTKQAIQNRYENSHRTSH